MGTAKTIDMLGRSGVSISADEGDDFIIEFTPEGVTVTVTRADQKMMCGIRHEDDRWRLLQRD